MSHHLLNTKIRIPSLSWEIGRCRPHRAHTPIYQVIEANTTQVCFLLINFISLNNNSRRERDCYHSHFIDRKTEAQRCQKSGKQVQSQAEPTPSCGLVLAAHLYPWALAACPRTRKPQGFRLLFGKMQLYWCLPLQLLGEFRDLYFRPSARQEALQTRLDLWLYRLQQSKMKIQSPFPLAAFFTVSSSWWPVFSFLGALVYSSHAYEIYDINGYTVLKF